MPSGSASSRDAVLVTGATGFLGMELLVRYLEHTDRRVYALVRAPDEAAAAARLRATLASLVAEPDAYAHRLTAVAGDLEGSGLGIEARRRDELAEQVSEIVHAAASISFTLPLERARAINVEGTRRVLEFAALSAARGGLRRLAHVSTAYVAGTYRGTFNEDQLEAGQTFRNTYERSKWEAERLVRAHFGTLPIQVFRPSIVVGEQRSGWTPAFNVIYMPLRAFAHGAHPVIPARRSAPVDVVPVDFVADAIFELFSRPDGAGTTYHLVAGSDAVSVGELIDLSAHHLDRPRATAIPPRIYQRLIHPLLVRRSRGARRRWLERSEIFFPYFALDTTYDNRRARSALEPAGIHVPPLHDYFGRLVDFALAASWGRHPIDRVDAVAPRPRRLESVAPSGADGHPIDTRLATTKRTATRPPRLVGSGPAGTPGHDG